MNRRLTAPAALAVLALTVGLLTTPSQAVTPTATAPASTASATQAAQVTKPTCKPKKAKKSKKASKCRKPTIVVTQPAPATTPEQPATPATPSKGQPKPPAYAPAGNPSAYTLMITDSSGRAGHWDYCKTIQYKLNPNGMSQDWAADIRTAFSKLTNATGLAFVDGGTTDIVPLDTTYWYDSVQEENVVYVAMADESQAPVLSGAVAGVGGPAWIIDDSGREPRMNIGGVVLDREADLAPGFGSRSRGQLLLHELGHVIGLKHVNDPSQIMNPYLGASSPTEFQAGDLGGFAHLASYDCF